MKSSRKKFFSIFTFVAGIFAIIGGALSMLAALEPFAKVSETIMNTHGYDNE